MPEKRNTANSRLKQVEKRLVLARARLELEETCLKRKVAKARSEALSAYSAADKKRTTKDWPTKDYTADQAIIPNVRTLNARGRAARRNNWAASSTAGSYRRNVVGIGITPRSTARDPRSGQEFEEFNRALDWWWERWARKKEYCDIERHRTLIESEGLGIEEFCTVGESLTILNYVPRKDMVGLTLQMIEPEQLDMMKTRNQETGNEIRGGVEIDNYGAPVAYWIYTNTSHMSGWKFQSERVPAERVLHLFRQDRIRQTRGVTRLAPVLTKMRHLGMYDEYQLLAAKTEACLGGAVERNMGLGDNDIGLPLMPGETRADPTTGADTIRLEPSMLLRLAPGEKMTWFTPQRPGSLYDPFVKAQIGQIAAGAGLDYAAVARDYSQGNFSSQRQGTLECNKEWDPLQRLMIDVWGRPIREAFKTLAVVEGRVEAPGFLESAEIRAAYLEDEWQGPPKHWVDPVKEAMAAKIALECKLRTLADLLAERGKYVYKEIDQHATEQEYAEKKGVYLPHTQPKAARTGAGLSRVPVNGGNEELRQILEEELRRELADELTKED